MLWKEARPPEEGYRQHRREKVYGKIEAEGSRKKPYYGNRINKAAACLGGEEIGPGKARIPKRRDRPHILQISLCQIFLRPSKRTLLQDHLILAEVDRIKARAFREADYQAEQSKQHEDQDREIPVLHPLPKGRKRGSPAGGYFVVIMF